MHSTWREQEFTVATRFKQAQRAVSSECMLHAQTSQGQMQLAVAIISARNLTASHEALSHAASATPTATNAIAASSKHMQKACYETFQTTNAFTQRIANVESLTRDVSNAIAMCNNGQQCQQGDVLRAAQQRSSTAKCTAASATQPSASCAANQTHNPNAHKPNSPLQHPGTKIAAHPLLL